MKRFIYNLALALLCGATLVSCMEDVDFSGDYDGEKLVLYACANPGASYLEARLYKSVFFLDPHDEVAWDGISGAQVVAVINGKSYSMLPDTSEEGLYWLNYQVKPNDSILVQATKEGYNVSTVYGKTSVPQAAAFTVDSYAITKEVYHSDIFDGDTEYYALTFDITLDDPAGSNFYKILLKEVDDNGDVVEIWDELYTKDPGLANFDSGLSGLFELMDDGSILVSGPFSDNFFDGVKRTIKFQFNTFDNSFYSSFKPSRFFVEIQSFSAELYGYCASRAAAAGGLFDDFFVGNSDAIYNNIEGGIGCVGAISTTIVPLGK